MNKARKEWLRDRIAQLTFEIEHSHTKSMGFASICLPISLTIVVAASTLTTASKAIKISLVVCAIAILLIMIPLIFELTVKEKFLKEQESCYNELLGKK